MDIQLKRGLLDVCVLAAIKNQDSYGYQIIKDMKPYVEISESTLYPILRRLEASQLLTVRSAEHNGRLRKYYRITEKGARNADAVESSLPFSVRRKAMNLIEPVEERLRRAAMIVARHENGENGCVAELSVGDGMGELISMRLLCADEEQAKQIEKNFRRDAEGYYQKILELLSEDKK